MGTEQRLETPGDVLRAYVGAFVDELARSGVRHVSICPGSRSTPLALMLRRNPAFKLWLHLDERSAAFFGLGIARALREPVALVCSSGTAAANFMPAVIEAAHSGVPLIVLTADRPAELRGIGQTQTIDQDHLYGSAAKWFAELLLPESTPAAIRYVRAVAARAVATARESFPGPVHLNFPFREPLVPSAGKVPVPAVANGGPAIVTSTARRAPTPSDLASLLARIASAERGVIVCGGQDDPELPAAAAELSQALGYPLLSDVLSLARAGPDAPATIDAFDAFLRNEAVAGELAPDLVIRLGAIPVSKPLTQYLERHASVPQVAISEDRAWPDPVMTASEVIRADPALTCRAIVQALSTRGDATDAPRRGWKASATLIADDPVAEAFRHRVTPWTGRWQALNAATRGAMNDAIASREEITEPGAFLALAEVAPEGTTVFAGNSMPVRDLDTFFPSGARKLTFMANRGASGIDGVVSTALGAAAVSPGRVVLCIGDISFYHDMNGLLASGRHGLNATIVLINNNGGGIFSFLPQADQADEFEELFGTPHGLDFCHAAAMYGLHYELAPTTDAYRRALQESFDREGVTLIEVRTRRDANVAAHRELWAAVNAAIAALPAET